MARVEYEPNLDRLDYEGNFTTAKVGRKNIPTKFNFIQTVPGNLTLSNLNAEEREVILRATFCPSTNTKGEFFPRFDWRKAPGVFDTLVRAKEQTYGFHSKRTGIAEIAEDRTFTKDEPMFIKHDLLLVDSLIRLRSKIDYSIGMEAISLDSNGELLEQRLRHAVNMIGCAGLLINDIDSTLQAESNLRVRLDDHLDDYLKTVISEFDGRRV